MTIRPRWTHGLFVLLTCALTALYVAGPAAGTPAVLVASLAPLAVFVTQRVRGCAPSARAWSLMVLGLALLTVHDATAVVARLTTGEPAGGPAHAATLLGGYLVLSIGGAIATAPLARLDPGGMVDAAIIALATTTVVWTTVVRPAQLATGVGVADQLSWLGLLLVVSALVGIVSRAFATVPAARPSLAYLTVAALGAFTGTLAGALTKDPATGERVWWVGLCWVVANLALAASAAHPTSRHLGGHHRSGRLSRRRLGFLGGALALNPVIALAEQTAGRIPDTVQFAVGSLLVLPLVLLRIGILARMHGSAEHRLHVLATHDDLTGLPNRRAVTDRIDELLARIEVGASPGAAVLFLDLDDFKTVNDVHGHPTGDRLLVEVAQRLRSAVRGTDLVARFGGDEFILVLEGDPDGARAAGLGAVERVLAAPVQLAELTASARASIGSAVLRPGESMTAEQLLSAADASMHRVKRARRERYDLPIAGLHVAPETAPAPS